MARRWTLLEEEERRQELKRLYVYENKTISEIGVKLGLSSGSVYDRLKRLGIVTIRHTKPRYNNQRTDIVVPRYYTNDLAELVGILLGDGHLTKTQVTVTLGSKEEEYAFYVANLLEQVFGAKGRIMLTKQGHRVVYAGSTTAVRWLFTMGLISHKVRGQVDVPAWILTKQSFMRAALRGLWDTDGSVYKLRYGVQLSFTNRSLPLLESTRKMLLVLGFHPSAITGFRFYLTRREDLHTFYREVGFKNPKHGKRYLKFVFSQVH
jgi:DNA-binding transcriptional regulator WhiA